MEIFQLIQNFIFILQCKVYQDTGKGKVIITDSVITTTPIASMLTIENLLGKIFIEGALQIS